MMTEASDAQSGSQRGGDGERQFKYSVALSLLSHDQQYAEELEAEIRKVVRGEVFFYRSRQDDLAADGELVERFTRVFRDEARVVVILYSRPLNYHPLWADRVNQRCGTPAAAESAGCSETE